jgi:predicted small metal-binding protein
MECDFEANAENEDELMSQITEHAAQVHDIKTMPPDIMEKVLQAITV